MGKLYTQQAQRIEVIVRKEGGNGEKNNRESETDEVSNNKDSGKNGAKKKQTKRAAVVTAMHTYAVAKQFANAEINYYIGGLGMASGDEAYQDRVSRQWEIVTDHTNVASSIAMGASFGAIGGPATAILGGVIGGLSAVISVGFKYRGREREFNYKLFKENNAIEYKRARANINLTTGRLR